jgi:pimeloyl-ACP methyl ester carboxylesterase
MAAAVSGVVQGRPKTLPEAKQWLRDKLAARVHPMGVIDPREGLELIDRLEGLDGASWAAVWKGAGDEVSARAQAAAAAGQVLDAERLFMKASGLYFLGRFPCPNHPAKAESAVCERRAYLAAARYWASPIERHEVPFAGRAGEADRVVCYLRRPVGVNAPPLVLMWGGVDAWKEQMTAASDAFLAKGCATIAMDNAGTGESPVKGVVDAERVFITVIDWARQLPGIAPGPIGLLGRSFGGYWVTKLAHLIPERIAGAVSWGGGVHYMYQRDWVQASRFPDSYLMELVETRMRMLGVSSDEDYVEAFARLSLLDQGLLDRPSAPLLLVNGKEDRQCPPADIHILLEHGSPKSVRLFPGGHMGNTPQTLPTVVQWLVTQLARKAA